MRDGVKSYLICLPMDLHPSALHSDLVCRLLVLHGVSS